MFTAADDANVLGLPVKHEAYPEGEEGIQKSLATICEKIREGAQTAVMKSYAANLMRQAGFPTSILDQGRAALEHVRANVLYAPDALGTEQIQRADITLCVEGAPICIPCGDCDDLTTALGTIMAALGIEVEVVRQIFGMGHQQHVLLEIRDEDGKWQPLDPSSKTMPAGQKVPAQRETRHSPFDNAPPGAHFVGIGALAVWRWTHEEWKQVGVGETLDPDACCMECIRDRKEGAMTHAATQTSRHGGLGAPWPGVTAFVAQWAWINQAWSALDAQHRSWSDALNSAYARAATRNWIPGDKVAASDLTALIVASAFSARAVASMPDQGQRAADALNRTWVIIADKLGWTPSQTIDDLKKKVSSEQNPTTAAAELALFEVIIAVVAIAAVATVYCFLIYFAYKIVDALLSRIVAFAELIYLQSQVQKIVDRHLANPNLPWTDEEKEMLQRLEDMQNGAHGAIVAPPSSDKGVEAGTPAWVWIGGAVVVSAAAIAFVYRGPIRSWLETGTPRRRLAASEGRRRRRRRYR